MFCAQNGHDQCARALIEAGANLNHENKNHVTALNLACDDGYEECALLLLRHGARADVVDDWGDSPLSVSKKKGMEKVLAMMHDA